MIEFELNFIYILSKMHSKKYGMLCNLVNCGILAEDIFNKKIEWKLIKNSAGCFFVLKLSKSDLKKYSLKDEVLEMVEK